MDTPPSPVDTYLDLMDSQRRDLVTYLERADPALLWQRPQLKAWSAGEQLDHTRAVLRCFRRVFAAMYVLQLPSAYLLRQRPYPTEMDDVYKRPGFPSKVGFLWSPRYTPNRPLPLSDLAALVEREHRLVRAFYVNKRPETLGHVWLYDPLIGWANLIQMLRVGVYHDQHHYASITRTLATLSSRAASS